MLKLIRPLVMPFLRLCFEEFHTSLRRPEEAQQWLLQNLIANLAATEYGRSLHIKADDRRDEFRAKTPVVTYDELSEWIERQKQREGRVLVNEPVLFYEKTSGSSGAAKLIPYTRSLQASFTRMVLVWLYDLLAKAPPLKTGKTFISVSPAFQQAEKTGHGIRVGLSDDADYLSGWAQALLKPFFLLPPDINRLQDTANFRHAVAALLIAEEGLEVVSVWNPSFLEILLDHISAQRESLVADLRRGRVDCEGLSFAFKPMRAERLALLAENPIDWPRVWERLQIISCWTSAQAAPAADRLRTLFPDVFLQGKGLLATEAPLTMPLVAAHGFVPLPAEVFYEFVDEAGRFFLLHELVAGREYDIILTQQGGLYRYRLGDRVRVSGFYEAAPCLEFVGRRDAVCDLVGEKLNERFVQRCLAHLSRQCDFQTLLPVLNEAPHYVLIVDDPGIEPPLAAELEVLLRGAYHYRIARLLGQLHPLRLLVAPKAREVFYDHFVRRGLKLGDIKHRFLLTNLEDARQILQALEAPHTSRRS